MDKKNLVWEVVRIAREHRKVVEKRICSLGIHPSQHQLLMYISQNRSCTQNSIAEAMEVSAATVAVSVKKLEKGGYIEKKICPEDGRSKRIALTEKGKAVVARSKCLFEEIDEKMLDAIPEEQLEQLHDCMKRIINNLKTLEENPLLAQAGEHFSSKYQED